MVGSDENCWIRMRRGPVPCVGERLMVGVGGASTSLTMTSGGAWYFNSVEEVVCCAKTDGIDGTATATTRQRRTAQENAEGRSIFIPTQHTRVCGKEPQPC